MLRCYQLDRRIGIEREIGPPLALHYLCAGEVRYVGMESVSRLEHGRFPPGATVCQAYRLEHLVRAVGSENLFRTDFVQLG